MNKITVIIAAAGRGRRLGSDIPKQFRKIAGEPVLVKTVRAFSSNEYVDEIVIVTNEEYIEHCCQLTSEYNLEKVTAVVEGGAERQDSVYKALQHISSGDAADCTLIHDAARPFISSETIVNVIDASVRKGAAIACVPVKDSIRQGTSEESRNIERSNLYNVQTPQGFRTSLLMEAYEKALEEELVAINE